MLAAAVGGKLVALRAAFLHKADVCEVLLGYLLFLLNDVFIPGPRSRRCKRLESASSRKSHLSSICGCARRAHRIPFKTRLSCLPTRNERPKNPAFSPGHPSNLLSHIPLPAALAFTPISSSFCVIWLRGPRCRVFRRARSMMFR